MSENVNNLIPTIPKPYKESKYINICFLFFYWQALQAVLGSTSTTGYLKALSTIHTPVSPADLVVQVSFAKGFLSSSDLDLRRSDMTALSFWSHTSSIYTENFNSSSFLRLGWEVLLRIMGFVTQQGENSCWVNCWWLGKP